MEENNDLLRQLISCNEIFFNLQSSNVYSLIQESLEEIKGVIDVLHNWLDFKEPVFGGVFNIEHNRMGMSEFLYSHIGEVDMLEIVKKAMVYLRMYILKDLPPVDSQCQFFLDYGAFLKIMDQYDDDWGGTVSRNIKSSLSYSTPGESRDILVYSKLDYFIESGFVRIANFEGMYPDLPYCWGVKSIYQNISSRYLDFIRSTLSDYQSYVYSTETDVHNSVYYYFKRTLDIGDNYKFCVNGYYQIDRFGFYLWSEVSIGSWFTLTFPYEILEDDLEEYRECFLKVFNHIINDFLIEPDKLRTYEECKKELEGYLEFLKSDLFLSDINVKQNQYDLFNYKTDYSIEQAREKGFFLNFGYYENYTNPIEWKDMTSYFMNLYMNKGSEGKEEIIEENLKPKIMLNLTMDNLVDLVGG